MASNYKQLRKDVYDRDLKDYGADQDFLGQTVADKSAREAANRQKNIESDRAKRQAAAKKRRAAMKAKERKALGSKLQKPKVKSNLSKAKMKKSTFGMSSMDDDGKTGLAQESYYGKEFINEGKLIKQK